MKYSKIPISFHCSRTLISILFTDNVPMGQDNSLERPQSTHQHVQQKTEEKSQQGTVTAEQAYHQPVVTTIPSQVRNFKIHKPSNSEPK